MPLNRPAGMQNGSNRPDRTHSRSRMPDRHPPRSQEGQTLDEPQLGTGNRAWYQSASWRIHDPGWENHAEFGLDGS